MGPSFSSPTPPSKLPVNGGERRSTVAAHRKPPPDHRRTTTDHQSTMVEIVVWQVGFRSNTGQVATWHHQREPRGSCLNSPAMAKLGV
nr:hypothetical protein [Tanacetum cinerariifolium]